jgi:hypothetical protein
VADRKIADKTISPATYGEPAAGTIEKVAARTATTAANS